MQGAQKQGIRSHIRAKKKFDNAGVGQAEAAKRGHDWTLEMCNLSSTLGGLKEVVSRHASGVASESDDDTDTPVHGVSTTSVANGTTALAAVVPQAAAVMPAVPAGKRKARKAAADHPQFLSAAAAEAPAAAVIAEVKKSKKRKVDKAQGTAADAQTTDDVPAVAVTAPAAVAAPAVMAAQEAVEPATVPAVVKAEAAVKRAKHEGRYTRREKNKLVKGYSAADLAAILGQTSAASSAEAFAPLSVPVRPASAPVHLLVPSRSPTPASVAASDGVGISTASADETTGSQQAAALQPTEWWSRLFLQCAFACCATHAAHGA